MNPLNWTGAEFLALWIGGGIGVLLLSAILKLALTSKTTTPPTVSELADQLDPTEVAYLAGGIERAIEATIAGLHHRRLLQLQGDRLVAAGGDVAKIEPESTYRGKPAGESLSDLEQFVIDHVRRGYGVGELLHPARKLEVPLAAKLEQAHLLVADRVRVWIWAGWPSVAWLMLGGAKLLVGVSRERPVGFLLICLAAFALAAYHIAKPGTRTAKGERLLTLLRDRLPGLETTVHAAPEQVSGTDLTLAYAVFGGTLLGGSALAMMMPSYQRALMSASVSSSTGCGSSCGGGGCGGGCGGCGGCS